MSNIYRDYSIDFKSELYDLIDAYKDKNIMIHGLRDLESGIDSLRNGFYFRTLCPELDEIYSDDELYSIKDQNLELLHGTCSDVFYIPYLENLGEVDFSFNPVLDSMFSEVQRLEGIGRRVMANNSSEALTKVLNYDYIDGRGRDYLLLISVPLDEKVVRKVSEEDRLDKPYVCNCDAILDPKYIVALIDKVNGRIIRFNEDRKIYKFGYEKSK